jgi:hypothetical protein
MTQCICNGETTLREMLEDPTVQLLMTRDGVARAELENLMIGVASAAPASPAPAARCCCSSLDKEPFGTDR